MKRCPICGRTYEDFYTFCKEDGAKLAYQKPETISTTKSRLSFTDYRRYGVFVFAGVLAVIAFSSLWRRSREKLSLQQIGSSSSVAAPDVSVSLDQGHATSTIGTPLGDANVEKQKSVDVPSGSETRRTPRDEVQIKANATVGLTVSKGPEQMEQPKGKTINGALELITCGSKSVMVPRGWMKKVTSASDGTTNYRWESGSSFVLFVDTPRPGNPMETVASEERRFAKSSSYSYERLSLVETDSNRNGATVWRFRLSRDGGTKRQREIEYICKDGHTYVLSVGTPIGDAINESVLPEVLDSVKNW